MWKASYAIAISIWEIHTSTYYSNFLDLKYWSVLKQGLCIMTIMAFYHVVFYMLYVPVFLYLYVCVIYRICDLTRGFLMSTQRSSLSTNSLITLFNPASAQKRAWINCHGNQGFFSMSAKRFSKVYKFGQFDLIC